MINFKLQYKKDENYEKYLFSEDLKFIRQMLVLSLVLYSAFGLVDRWLDVDNLYIFTIIRFYIVAPFNIIIYLLSYHKSFFKLHQYLLTALYGVAGIGIVLMLTITPNVFSYYGGLFLIFGYGYFLLRLKWQFVTIGSIVILFVYFTLAFIHLSDHLNDVLVYSIFYITFIIIAISGSYTFSRYRFERYLQETHLKGDNVVLEKQIYKNLKDIENSNYITIYSLAKLAESRDKFTGNHIDRVGSLCLKLAKQIHKSVYIKNKCDKEEFVKSIELASTLHDIGKIGIPENIVMKPAKYTKEEFEIMKEHCMLGSTTLREIQNKYSKNSFINMGIDICESHHENWDGSGYPRKLKDRDIPFSARIVSVVDVYDALISERPYKKAWTVEASVKEIISLSGIKFDSDIVDAFLYCIDFNN
ncbi:MAG: Cyclic di-GMP phosphodiesterase response regulator RpfG [Candidatus Izimaplasma bacterium HR2]|nr:MAG: Cyclic di-GMP phosphodiesterase response regulator RpfG [Candidatus Izimaplasma bacterium HR2]